MPTVNDELDFCQLNNTIQQRAEALERQGNLWALAFRALTPNTSENEMSEVDVSIYMGHTYENDSNMSQGLNADKRTDLPVLRAIAVAMYDNVHARLKDMRELLDDLEDRLEREYEEATADAKE